MQGEVLNRRSHYQPRTVKAVEQEETEAKEKES
jgi:hypothetical protein